MGSSMLTLCCSRYKRNSKLKGNSNRFPIQTALQARYGELKWREFAARRAALDAHANGDHEAEVLRKRSPGDYRERLERLKAEEQRLVTKGISPPSILSISSGVPCCSTRTVSDTLRRLVLAFVAIWPSVDRK